jgi:5-methyltetrahydropteroyltriglutamate--homocysteine methyltransferase
MLRSEGRILTTHAGSLPRPSELTHLYAERARGAPIDAATIEQAGRAALRWVVPSSWNPGSISATTASSNAKRFSFMSSAG